MNQKYFLGNEISEYGMENGKVDYAALAKSFSLVLNNKILEESAKKGYIWDLENGDLYEKEYDEEYDVEEEIPKEIFQYYIIDECGVNILSHYTDEIVFYNEDLDMHIWGVCHLSTSETRVQIYLQSFPGH